MGGRKDIFRAIVRVLTDSANVTIGEYEVDNCDVPNVRRGALRDYRALRRKCLEYLRGDSETSVANQVHELVWDTVVFRTLNEARRIEPNHTVNGATWELMTKGYPGIMTLGVRRLVDRDQRVDSVWNAIAEIEKHSDLLTRENFVCHDGLPYDYEKVERHYLASLDRSRKVNVRWAPSEGLHVDGQVRCACGAYQRSIGPHSNSDL